MQTMILLTEFGGIIGGLVGAFLLYRQRPGTYYWLIWIGIALVCLLKILFKF